MNSRCAQAEGVGEIAEREPRVEREFQRDDEVLGVELHRTSIRSIFQNVEQSRQQAFFLGYFDVLAAAQKAHPNRVRRSKKAETQDSFDPTPVSWHWCGTNRPAVRPQDCLASVRMLKQTHMSVPDGPAIQPHASGPPASRSRMSREGSACKSGSMHFAASAFTLLTSVLTG